MLVIRINIGLTSKKGCRSEVELETSLVHPSHALVLMKALGPDRSSKDLGSKPLASPRSFLGFG